jgi:hypothetical protein
MECWKFAYLSWKTVTLLKGRSMACCLLTEDNWSHFLQWNGNRWTVTRNWLWISFTFWKLTKKTAGFSKMGLRRIQQIQQCRCWASSLVVALFLETCDALDPRIYRHRIFIFCFFFLRECVQNNPHTSEELKQNIELCIWNVTAETLHRVASDMRKGVNACNTERGGHFQHFMWQCLSFSHFNVIYLLANRSCVRNGLCDF